MPGAAMNFCGETVDGGVGRANMPSHTPLTLSHNNNNSSASSACSADHKNNNNSDKANICAGCGQVIVDRYLLQALGRLWHEDCLKCGCCSCRLGEVGSSLYTRANMILCRRDYLRLFGSTGYCSACSRIIPAFEMVMRAKNNVYHLECFACQQCSHRFCVGDKFYLCENKILCEYDYEERLVFASLAFNPAVLAQIRGSSQLTCTVSSTTETSSISNDHPANCTTTPSHLNTCNSSTVSQSARSSLYNCHLPVTSDNTASETTFTPNSTSTPCPAEPSVKNLAAL